MKNNIINIRKCTKRWVLVLNIYLYPTNQTTIPKQAPPIPVDPFDDEHNSGMPRQLRAWGGLAIDGAAALADAMQKHDRNYELAFQDYNKDFRPFIEEVQEEAVRMGLASLVPRTEEAIRQRNITGF